MKKVAVVMGSDSDLGLMRPCIDTLKEFGIEADVRIISAHRTPRIAEEFSAKAYENGYAVIIAAAGKAAHLAGVIAAYTTLPVVGVPVNASLGGLDALLAMTQMPPGVPVGVMAIDGAVNAALFAAQIIAVHDPAMNARMADYKIRMAEKVAEKDLALQEKI